MDCERHHEKVDDRDGDGNETAKLRGGRKVRWWMEGEKSENKHAHKHLNTENITVPRYL
jgi:hypothetical protein